MIRVQRQTIETHPGVSRPRWFVERVDGNQITDLRNFDNEDVATIYAYRQSLKLAANEVAKERAKKIGAAAWYECIDKVMTDEDKSQVSALWATMPGHTCWTDAMFRWIDMTN
jgi:hypothetical protein